MTLLTYQVFKTVADIGSFRKAADILGLTPSAISHAISSMEAELGFSVLTRSKNGVTLTNYGSVKTLMVMGDKTGSSEVKIEKGISDYDSMVKLFECNTVLNLILVADNGIVAKAIISNIDSKDFTARLNSVGSAEYFVGDTGPAGGIIFYDKG